MQKKLYKTKEESEEISDQTSTKSVDLTKTDELLDKIDDILEDQEENDYKATLHAWASNQGRLDNSCETCACGMYKTCRFANGN